MGAPFHVKKPVFTVCMAIPAIGQTDLLCWNLFLHGFFMGGSAEILVLVATHAVLNDYLAGLVRFHIRPESILDFRGRA
jgi:hypothetical protein